MRSKRRSLAGSCAAALALCACSGGEPGSSEGQPLNAILITLDTTRADALGAYGRTRGVTPNLDRLRSEGVLYDEAFTVAPITLVAHASMLTGLYPVRHGVRDNGLWPLPQSARTLAEDVRDAGGESAAFLAAPVLGAEFGLDQGFDVYDIRPYEGHWEQHQSSERKAGEVVDAALAWLEGRETREPLLLWVHLFDPHSPYRDQPEFGEAVAGNEYPNRKYLGEVAYMDREIGRLLDGLERNGLLESSLVLTVADHGEALLAHGELSHGAFCYDETIRVPFLLRYPDGFRRGERSDEIVSVTDVYPTLAAAMGLSASSSVDGVNLFRDRVDEERGVYFESYVGFLSYGWSPLAGWLDAEGKYLHSSDPEFFDLRNDPTERTNLIARGADTSRYRNAIGALASLPALEIDAEVESSSEVTAELRKLGYAGIGLGPERVPHPLELSDAPSPKSRVQEQRDVSIAIGHCNAGRFKEAEPIFLRVLYENPRNYMALDMLAQALMQQKRHVEAIPHLQALVRDGLAKPAHFFNLGVCMEAASRMEEALAALRRAVELAPDELRFVRRLARTLERAGRADEAATYAERARVMESSK